MDELFEMFPTLLNMVLETKSREQKRTDITRLACALFESGAMANQSMSTNEVIDKACYLYERIESHVNACPPETTKGL